MSGCPSYRVRFFTISLIAVFLLIGISAGYSQPLSAQKGTAETPVNFTAKTLSHDDEAQTVTAIGDVELVQAQRILRADKVVYYLAEDKVTAIGNVSLLDEFGDVHFAEYVELRDHMKDGFIQGLLTLLADGSRFTAAEAKRENAGTKTTMTDATYTMCKVCEADPHPLWQLKAAEVTHDSTTREVDYKHARLEMLGLPIIYSPIFSHPDPTQKRKSGFLRPEYGWTNALGTHAKAAYYYAIAPDRDMTIGVEPTTLAGTLVAGEWRQRFAHGQLQINASTANSDLIEEDGTIEPDRQRGHIFANGKMDINDLWRSGFTLAHTSDKQYLRLYDLPDSDDVLTNQVYAERFEARDYSRISAYNFQDVRLGVRPDQPDILPMAEHNMIGEPGSLWGGRWQASVSALGLNRDGVGQKVQRGSVDVGWERRGISTSGVSTTAKLDAREDYYVIEDNDAAKIDPLIDRNPRTGRGMATASVISSYPLAKTIEAVRAQAVIEPVVGVSISPKVNQTNNVIPNEDSIDTRFDINNLFQQNRYPGIDRQEDGSRMNYGIKTGLYGDNGRYGKIDFGQSLRFSGDKIFPQGSGLEDRFSDYVGQVKVGLSQYLDADYRFQLDSRTLAAKRHEVQAGGGNDLFRLNSRYLYTAAVDGTGLESRQQIQMDGTYNLTKTWVYNASALMDVGNQPGLRNAATGLQYADECFTFSIQGSRNVADAASGDDETKLLIRIGLKSIGEFAGPKISLGGNQLKNKQ